MKFIKELVEGERVTSQFLVSNAARGVNNLGAPYLNIELKDASGQIPAKKWEVNEEDNDIFVVGNVVEATCEIIKYKDNLQAKVITAKLLNEEDIDIVRLIQSAPIPMEELKKSLLAFVNSVKDPDCLALLNYFLNKYESKIYVYPAASSIHHEYSSGLLMHIVSMAKMGEFIAANYKNINRDLLITGIILHDIGKLTELEGPVIYHYSLEGKLLGHISIMAAEIKEAANKLNLKSEVPLLLEHMILSHHGQHEYGSPVLPLTSEALALHLIDNTDSKLTILNKALDDTEEGQFTQKIFALDGRLFYKHK
ncbi:MAG: HD domain-containing protein [Bacilli bacterium]|nr:HD domain-containing protein [Bacilli bacterium]